MSKITRITLEILGAQPNENRLRELLDRGWRIVHDRGTAYVSMQHSKGGAFSLCEVKTYGGPFTTGEADTVAAMIAEDLQKRFAQLQEQVE